MIFKGGTSLSKAYDVIHRFSEDVDLSLDRTQLGFEGDRDPENPDLSGKKQKQLLQDLQAAAEVAVSGPLLADIQAAFDGSLSQDFTLSVDPNDTQTLLFTYPSLTGRSAGYIKPIGFCRKIFLFSDLQPIDISAASFNSSIGAYYGD